MTFARRLNWMLSAVLAVWCLLRVPAFVASHSLSSLEFNALHALYNSTQGENWDWKYPISTHGVVWNFSLPSNPCGGWQGVVCNSNCSLTACFVTKLSLSNYHLNGTLPVEIQSLSSLVELDLSLNSLIGTLPRTVSQFRTLSSLDLSNNLFSQTLPSTMFELSTLVNLDLSANQFVGSISAAIEALQSLTTLYLNNNLFSQSIPAAVGNLKQLKILALHYNHLTGAIPESVGNLTGLTTFYVNNNQLQSSLPVSLGFLQTLQYLNVASNKLNGPLLSNITSWKNMLALGFGNNQFTGSIPQEYTKLTSLTSFGALGNSLTGSIPEDFTRLSKLQMLLLGMNKLRGTIPTEIGNLTRLILLSVGNNEFTGSLPSSICRLSSLTYFAASNNLLNGTLPACLSNMTRLTTLLLNGNQLSGSIPGVLPSTLQQLSLSSNGLNGTLPETLGALPSLYSLNISDNYLHGTLPASIGNLQQLHIVTADNNSLVGTLPSSWSNLSELTALYLADNYLEGPIPPAFGSLSKLSILQLQNNMLSHTIPESFGQLQRLFTLMLQDNYLTGLLPQNLSSISTLKQLVGSANLLSGVIDSAYRQIPVLGLSYNRFVGPLSTDFFGPPALAVDISDNMLTGDLTNALAVSGPRAQILLMDNNFLTGSILGEVWTDDKGNEDATSFVNFNVSNNLFEGTLSSNWSRFSIVESFCASVNYFSGAVTGTFRSMTKINNLRLSNNFLSGPLETSATAPFLNTSNRYVVVQVDSNIFTGDLPVGMLSQGNVESFAASLNCLSYHVPSEVCNNDVLSELLLDGLHSSVHCRTLFLPTWRQSGYVSDHTEVTSDGIPSCLFSMPHLKTLHLAGNGYDQKLELPTGVSSESLFQAMEDLDLSHNSLKGTVPAAVWQHNFTSLDLSFNRLKGTIPGYVASYSSNETSITLQVNRFSGLIPHNLLDAASINILNGNLFTCHGEESVERTTMLPSNDPRFASYNCGSDDTDYTLAAIAGLFGVMFTATVVFLWSSHPVVQRLMRHYCRWQDAVASAEGSALYGVEMQNIYRYSVVISKLVRYVSLLTVVMVVIGIPMYAGLSVSFGMHTHSYIWVVSMAFISGLTPALVLFFCLLLLLISCRMLLRRQTQKLEARGLFLSDTKQSASVFSLCYFWSRWTKEERQRALWKLALLTCNVVIVLVVNGTYVYIAGMDFNSPQSLYAISFLLSIFKLAWNIFVNQTILGDEHILPLFQFAVPVFNNILAPYLAEAFVSPNCFQYAVIQPPPVTSMANGVPCFALESGNETPLISVAEFIVYAQNTGDLVTCQPLDTISSNYTIASSFSTITSISYYPAFTYNYLCSSTLLTTFVYVFLLRYAISGIFIPCVALLLKYLQERLALRFGSNSASVGYITRMLPYLMQPLDAEELTTDVDEQERIRYFNSRIFPKIAEEIPYLAPDLRIRLVSDLAVCLTFGVLFPPLMMVIALSVFVDLLMTQLRIGRLVCMIPPSVAYKRFSARQSKRKLSIFTVSDTSAWGARDKDETADMDEVEGGGQSTSQNPLHELAGPGPNKEEDEGKQESNGVAKETKRGSSEGESTSSRLARDKHASTASSMGVQRLALQDIVSKLNASFSDFEVLLWQAFDLTIIVAAVFWSMSLFDILGDDVGAVQAAWIFVLMGSAPAWLELPDILYRFIFVRACGFAANRDDRKRRPRGKTEVGDGQHEVEMVDVVGTAGVPSERDSGEDGRDSEASSLGSDFRQSRSSAARTTAAAAVLGGAVILRVRFPLSPYRKITVLFIYLWLFCFVLFL